MHEETAEQEYEREIRGKMLSVIDHKINPNDDERADENMADGLAVHIIFSFALMYTPSKLPRPS